MKNKFKTKSKDIIDWNLKTKQKKIGIQNFFSKNLTFWKVLKQVKIILKIGH